LTGRLDSIQAAVLLAKMEIFDDEVAARERAAVVYARLLEDAFGPDGHVKAPWVAPGNTSVYAQYTIEVDEREIVETRMKALGVPTAVHYPMSLHEQPVFGYLGQPAGSFPVSEAAARRVLSLPMHPYLTEQQQEQVIAALAEAVGHGR
jgi:UDP-2-acetamido-2-deoxy-ribo-hexuluronate aminotransferase